MLFIYHPGRITFPDVKFTSDDRYSSCGAFVIATWNISGGQSSAQAPKSWVPIDQKAAVIKEIIRWNADIFSLQECESSDAYDAFIPQYTFLGAAAAHCGYVHVYVRLRKGFLAETILEKSLLGHPVVQATLTLETGVVKRRFLKYPLRKKTFANPNI